MPTPILTYPIGERQESVSVRDRISLALAIADSDLLKSLLVDCTPPIAPHHLIGDITSSIGVPLPSGKAADGIILFETIHCVLADSQTEIEGQLVGSNSRDIKRRVLARLTQCESETQTLGQNISFAQALALLTQVGFLPQQIDAILNLSGDARYKCWWYTLDSEGNLSVPFLRLLRTLHYPNGSLTIQYKDYFSQEQPSCFNSQAAKVLVQIKAESQSFRTTVENINVARKALGITKAIVICDSLSDLEARGFIHQGISLYTATEIILPVQANCALCMRQECPMQGKENSPVMRCRRFCLQGS